MGLLQNIFGRKPGGTFVGNLIRNAASTATGGVLGQGQMKITQEEFDRKNLSDVAYYNKYGVSKPGANPSVLPYLQQAAGAAISGAVGGIGVFNSTGANASNINGGNFSSNTNIGISKAESVNFLSLLVPLLVIVGLTIYILKLKK
ncbi:MAG: hypothetical protein JST62_01055 [Bacteroidetes bacterium]|nr:hypothetical protein [Bacteroidota bacterium]